MEQELPHKPLKLDFDLSFLNMQKNDITKHTKIDPDTLSYALDYYEKNYLKLSEGIWDTQNIDEDARDKIYAMYVDEQYSELEQYVLFRNTTLKHCYDFVHEKGYDSIPYDTNTPKMILTKEIFSKYVGTVISSRLDIKKEDVQQFFWALWSDLRAFATISFQSHTSFKHFMEEIYVDNSQKNLLMQRITPLTGISRTWFSMSTMISQNELRLMLWDNTLFRMFLDESNKYIAYVILKTISERVDKNASPFLLIQGEDSPLKQWRRTFLKAPNNFDIRLNAEKARVENFEHAKRILSNIFCLDDSEIVILLDEPKLFDEYDADIKITHSEVSPYINFRLWFRDKNTHEFITDQDIAIPVINEDIFDLLEYFWSMKNIFEPRIWS